MTAFSSESIYLIASLICACAGAFTDVRTRKIPNILTGPSILFGLLLHFIAGGWRWQAVGSAAVAGLVGGLVFLVFHLAGGMGGGDVKLMTAVCTIAGFNHVVEILIATALMGGVFAVVLALSRRQLKSTLVNMGVLFSHHRKSGLLPHSTLNVSNPAALRLPYGLAIAAGTAVSLCSVILR